MKEKILLLSWAVPPAPTGSAVIVANLAKQFSRDEMIVAGEKPYGVPPVPWSDRWPPVVYVRYVWPFLRGARLWQPLQFPYVLLRCIQLVLWHRLTSILVVYPKPPFVLAGYLTAVLTRRKLYIYFHNTYYENAHGWHKRFAGWLQRRLFQKAKHVFVMSEGMAELFRERYPGLKQSPLVHTFNGPIPEFAEPPQAGTTLRLFMIGDLITACADAAARFVQAVALTPNVQLTLLTGYRRNQLEQRGLLCDNIACETVASNQVLQRLAEADIVLLPHGLKGPLAPEEYQTIFPTRVVDYLLCGRPILAHSTAGSYITRFLIDNRCALVVEKPDVELLCDAIERLRTDTELRSQLVRNALKTAEQFQASRVVAQLRQYFA